MKDSFGSSVSDRLGTLLDAQLLRLQFGDKEKQVLRLFYDERLKVRKKHVPKFHIYARLCDGKDEKNWFTIMLDADRALDNLKAIHCIQEVQPSVAGGLTRSSVGPASVLFELTASGLEALQSWYPPLALRLRAWITVAPPWIVLAATIAGGFASAWKLFEVGLWLSHKLGYT